MKVLITGVAGFVGSALARRAIERSWDVVGYDSITEYYDPQIKRHNLALLERLGGDFRFVEGDTRAVLSERDLNGADVVFHEAGQPGVRASWDAGFGLYTDLNILATQDLLEKLRRTPGVRLVMASSSSVYGNAERYPVTESVETRPFSPYGVTKLAAERLAVAYALNFGIDVVVLRYFTVYGPGQRPDMAMHRLVRAALEGRSFPLYGDGSQIRDFTFVDDVVAANFAAVERAGLGPLVANVCGGSSIALTEVIATVEDLTGRPLLLERRGSQAGDVTRTGGDSTLLRSVAGWEPVTSVRAGLTLELDWMAGLLATTAR